MSTSSASTPRGASAAAASRTSWVVAAMPSCAENSATAGSQSRTDAGSAAASPNEMYGGLETIARRPVSGTGPSREPCRSSSTAHQRPAKRSAFARATASASSDTSVPITRAKRPSLASDMAMAPDPVPTSTATPPRSSRVSSRTISTSCSVSGRGMSTRSSTSSVKCRNAARPAAYWMGAPLARRRAAWRAASHAGAPSTTSRASDGQ